MSPSSLHAKDESNTPSAVKLARESGSLTSNKPKLVSKPKTADDLPKDDSKSNLLVAELSASNYCLWQQTKMNLPKKS